MQEKMDKVISSTELSPDFELHYKEKIKPKEEMFKKIQIANRVLLSQRRLIYYGVLFFAISIVIIYFKHTGFAHYSLPSTKFGSLILVFSIILPMFGLESFYRWSVAPAEDYKIKVKNEILPLIYEFWNLGCDGSHKLITRSFKDLINFRNLRKNYKDFDLVESLHLAKNGCIWLDKYQDSGIIPDFSIERNYDELRGNREGIQLSIFRSILKKEVWYLPSKHKQLRLIQIFNGIFVISEFEKKFPAKTIVNLSSGFFEKINNKNLESFYLKDERSNSLLEVSSESRGNAKQLLTQDVVDNILTLNEVFDEQDLVMSFYNNRLIIKIRTDGELFVPQAIFKDCDFTNDCKTIFPKINAIFKLIESIKRKINSETWFKDLRDYHF